MKPIQIYDDQGSINSQLISDFEASEKLKFPTSYKNLIKQHNCLRPENSSFKFQNIYANKYSWSYKIENGIDSRDISFYGFGNDIPEYSQISRAQSFDIYGHDHVIAFGDSANGDYICFDYRHDPQTSEPRIVVMFHDAYDENRKMLICPVANTFEEFMDSLYKPVD